MAVESPIITISSLAPASQVRQSTSTHRLATQSAADALQGLVGDRNPAIHSGLKYLDSTLGGNGPSAPRGYQQGKVAEIWGPAGAGKTALAFQAAVETLKSGKRVVWIDCATPLCATRLATVSQNEFSDGRSGDELLEKEFHYSSVPTLAHLLALIMHHPANFPPEATALLVIDGVNKLIDLDYPRLPFSSSNRSEHQKWQATRRYSILGSLVTAMSKLAVMRNMAVIATTGCNSRMRTDDGLGAAIGPGVGGTEWESGIWARVVVFRDFHGRFAGVQKCQGRNIMPLDPTGDIRNAIGFEIAEHGTIKDRHVTVDLTSSSPAGPIVRKSGQQPASSETKRKRTYDEIADSEEEGDVDEYGWAEKDDDVLIIDEKPGPAPAQQVA